MLTMFPLLWLTAAASPFGSQEGYMNALTERQPVPQPVCAATPPAANAGMWPGIRELQRRGFAPTWILDGGAANGKWSTEAHTVFGSKQFALVSGLDRTQH